MAELYLVRHGQASFGSDNYDQLSELGYQQARWLGEYFRERNIEFDRMIVGAMARHHQTAESICEGLAQKPSLGLQEHTGFNEFDFKQIIQAYVSQHPDQVITDWNDKRQVYSALRNAMKAWSRDELANTELSESWLNFQERVLSAMAFAREGNHRRTLVASSGGAISMALGQVMGFGSETLININLQSKNTGISHFLYNEHRIYITSFNQVPHLDLPGRLDAITHT